MMDFGKWALDNRKFIYFATFILIAGGIISYVNMSKLEDPEIRVKQAVVVTTYPGASAHEVELEVTEPLESAIRSIKGVETVSSRSQNDVSIIEVYLYQTVPDKEVEQKWDILRRKVGDIAHSLPKAAGKPIVKDDFGDVSGLFYAITNDGYSPSEMRNYLEYLKREIKDIDGVTTINIYGLEEECVNIELLQNKMANMGVHPAEVLATLNGQNQTTYSGYFLSGNNRIRVTINDRYKTAAEIGELLLQGHENDQLRLKDIASVTTDTEQPVRNELFYDGQRAYGFLIATSGDRDITKTGRTIDSKIEELKENIPAGINFNKVFFQPERVTESLNSFIINLLLSISIVIVVLMFAMGFKSGMIIGFNLLVIVLGTLLILKSLDGTLQRVSLGTFVLAMGMLVDNAIVIIDGILTDIKRGKRKSEALTAIGKKTAMPLLGATLIAILAFFPIFLSPDTAGVYVRDLFIVLAVSLIISWILALTLVPVQASFSIAKKSPETDSAQKDPFDTKSYKLLRKVLTWTLCHKTTSIVIATILVAGSAFSYRFLPQGFFPDMEYNQVYIEYKLPEGTSPDKVKEDLSQISGYLRETKEVTHITTSIGGTPGRYNLVRSIATPSLSYGELIVDFNTPEDAVDNIPHIQRYLMENYPEAYARVKRYNLMYKKFPIEAQFSGPDPEILRSLTSQAQAIMDKDNHTYLACNNWEPKVPVMVADYNQPTARALGLSRSDIATSLLAATDGIPTGVFYNGRNRTNIYLKSKQENHKPVADLSNTQVFGMVPPIGNLVSKQTLTSLLTGKLNEEEVIGSLLRSVPVTQATNGFKIEWHEPVVNRVNGQRSMKAQCEPVPGVSAETARESIAKAIEAIELPAGYSLQWEGEHKASTQSTKYLFKNFPLAIILMISILILLFGDYRKPLIIILCIPLLFVGVVYGMLLSGKVFGFVAIVGILGLIGMIIKNGVILMDEISLQLSQDKDPMTALLDSSSNRFRPVMMASLTTILGMIPLLGDDLFGSLAVTIMGGLLVGTVVTLLFIPILYAIFFKIKTDKK
jgi:multidrug efflux pump subunit AcrB